MNYGKCLTAMSKGLAAAAVTMGLAASSLCAGQKTVLHTFTGVERNSGSAPGSLTFDARGLPWHEGHLAGVDGCYELMPVAAPSHASVARRLPLPMQPKGNSK